MDSMDDIGLELKQFYPNHVARALNYLIDRHSLSPPHAAHIIALVWHKLNTQNPWVLPPYVVLLEFLHWN